MIATIINEQLKQLPEDKREEVLRQMIEAIEGE